MVAEEREDGSNAQRWRRFALVFSSSFALVLAFKCFNCFFLTYLVFPLAFSSIK